MKRKVWKESRNSDRAFKGWTGLEWVYSFNEDGEDQLGWFFEEFEGRPVFQYSGAETVNGEMIFEGDRLRLDSTIEEHWEVYCIRTPCGSEAGFLNPQKVSEYELGEAIVCLTVEEITGHVITDHPLRYEMWKEDERFNYVTKK